MAHPCTPLAEEELHFETTTTIYHTLDPRNTSEFGSSPYYEYDSQINHVLDTYVTPVLTSFSVIGNLLIFAVFSMKYYKSNLTAMLYRVLATTDGISVVIRIGYHSLPETSNDAICKAIMCFLCWSRVVSLYLIVIITTARLIIVWYPHKAKQLNTKRRYTCIIGALTMLSAILVTPLMATAGYNSDFEISGQPRVCMFFRRNHVGKMEWYRLVFNISIVFSILITMLFVFISNSFIVYGIKRSQLSVNAPRSSTYDGDQRKNKNVIIILMITSTSVLLNFPDVVYAVLSSYYYDPYSAAFSSQLMFRDFLPVFDSINRSINIIFFCVFGAEFRYRLKELVCRPCKTTDLSNSFASSIPVRVTVW